MDTKDINTDGKIKTTDDIEAGGNLHVHGSETIDNGLNVKGNTTLGDNPADKLTVNATSEFTAPRSIKM